ncbi:calcium/sodium antiporter [Oceanospirillum linum]|uniref:Calcium/sodium antiporter n=1 Tax=Oceanospirillum linum TaxID=966 RepID=A0A1T1H9U8_OCELI|nr:calcium/sodium antiporter [Oceanospirillum linum]OOV86487.1 calcium/sodium antiporter [Oceanospirillum linum]SEG34809.1 cation:H+ antiporter [Oleiphilus messinensis]SMP29559.1 cation:H+ antiporter [Oceanospirillum linum]
MIPETLPFSIAALIIGLALLVWSADRFIAGAAATAKNLGMSPMLIGMTIVSIGTSAPEILVSAIAAIGGNPGLAVGNALGSNIANIGLVLGITALIAPLPINMKLMRKEIPLLLGITLLAGAVMIDGQITLVDSLILVAALVLSLLWLFKGDSDSMADQEEEIPDMPQGKAIFWLLLGLALLIGSSRMLVWGAINIATSFGISDVIIGLTIVAIGTSLPELAASVASALKRHHEIALGNVVGSNIFNLLAVLPVPGFFATVVIDPDVMGRDYLTMAGLTLLVAALIVIMRKKGKLNRLEGGILSLIYIGYLYTVYLAAI